MGSQTQGIVDGLALITAPRILQDLHADATVFFDLSVNWLGLELESLETSDFTHQEKANALLPEVNARFNLLWRDLSDAKWVLNLP